MSELNERQADLAAVKQSISWPQLLESVGWQIGKNGTDKGTVHCQKHGADKHPSLHWHEGKGFYCFACAHGGDKIDFLMWVLGSDFLGAKNYLYQLAGIPVEFKQSTKEQQSTTKKRDQNLDKNLELYRVFKLELAVTQFSFQVRKTTLTHQLQALDENREGVSLSEYFNKQQILDYKLAALDEEDVSVCFQLKKKLENYGRKYLAR